MAFYEIFFSPTGGTKKAADLLASAWDGEITRVDLIHQVPSLARLKLHKDDLCLVAVPSFGGRVPSAAVQLLSSLRGGHARAIALAVFGNRAIDDTLLELQELLTASGFRCAAAAEAVAQHSLAEKIAAGRPDDRDAAQLRQFSTQLKQLLSRDDTVYTLQLPGNRPYKIYKGVPIKPSAGNKCIGCGLCAMECPVGAIPRNQPKVTDTRKCISCMHCVAICPVKARSISRILAAGAAQSLKKVCADRKENKLYLPDEKEGSLCPH